MKNAILLTLLLACCTALHGQFYKNIDLEFGVNRSKIINTSTFFPESRPDYGRYRSPHRHESSSYSNNLSLSAGIKLFKNHHLRFRYSKNRLGSYLTGSFHFQGWCGVGGGLSRELDNALNQIDNESFGLIYEYQIPLKFGKVAVGLGTEKQNNTYYDALIMLESMPESNYAIHSSAGIIIPMFRWFELHPKVFMTKSLTDTDSEMYEGSDEIDQPEYIPLQLAVEIGLRINLQKR